MHVFVTGVTGLIGRALAGALLSAGHTVTGLSRSARGDLPAGVRRVQGDPAEPGAWEEALAQCDACVNLAGESIVAGRWTRERKQRIRRSRIAGTARIANVIAKGGPGVLVSGSAVGYYGPRGDEPLDESATPGNDFLAEATRDWEAVARSAEERARLVLLRTGMVLAAHGGALPAMLLPFKAFLGGPIGDGRFWMSWIHLADELRLIQWALEDDRVRGPLNATAPEPARNLDFARALGRVLGRPTWMRAPATILRMALGEMAEVLTTGQRVLPKRAQELGHRFQYPTLDLALADLLGATRAAGRAGGEPPYPPFS